MDDLESRQRNKSLVRDFLDTVFNKHQVDEGIARFMGPTYTQHNPAVSDGVEGFRVFFRAFFKERPEASFTIKRLYCEDNFVTVHAHWKDRPADRGHAVMDIFRVENGRVVEHWDVMQPIPEKLAHDNTMF
jgi:predicted SnoaL-like aldol condensation-catalyzing enzyme